MEKYGNSGCHQKSATESTSGVQSNSGSCIIISCIMTTGIDNILKAIIKFSSFYQWWCLSRNMKRTKQITLRRLNSDLRNVGVVTRGPIGCLFNILRCSPATQGPRTPPACKLWPTKLKLFLTLWANTPYLLWLSDFVEVVTWESGIIRVSAGGWIHLLYSFSALYVEGPITLVFLWRSL